MRKTSAVRFEQNKNESNFQQFKSNNLRNNNSNLIPSEQLINNFSQQNLCSTFPTFTVTKIYKKLVAYSLMLYILSIVTYIANTRVVEFRVDYTRCVDYLHSYQCENTTNIKPCICKVKFNITTDIPKDAFIYYEIEGMYQNHMAYSESRDFLQLYGSTDNRLVGDRDQCGQFTEDTIRRAPYVPCGQLLNSIFNDTFLFEFIHPNKTDKLISLPLIRDNLRYKPKRLTQNPRSEVCEKYSENSLKCSFRNGVPPPNWRNNIWNLSEIESNNGYLNDDLINWITISTTNNVKKLWAIVDHDKRGFFQNSLPKGQYQVTIYNNYPTSIFGGRKRILLSNTSWLGGKNFFFSFITFLLAILSTACSIYCYYLHLYYGKTSKRMHDYLIISERRDHRMRTSYILAHNSKPSDKMKSLIKFKE